ncbi:hypothetical protein, partial [Acinetobacter baumannii]|uniref:hypothetical protein n=1 Tax=Acinetobacter baumannii TaxID=470 RepID=UPI001146C89D
MTALLPGFVTPDADTGPRNVSEKANSSHSRPAIRKFRPDIEGIRAFAVLSVVLYHAQLGVRGG